MYSYLYETACHKVAEESRRLVTNWSRSLSGPYRTIGTVRTCSHLGGNRGDDAAISRVADVNNQSRVASCARSYRAMAIGHLTPQCALHTIEIAIDRVRNLACARVRNLDKINRWTGMQIERNAISRRFLRDCFRRRRCFLQRTADRWNVIELSGRGTRGVSSRESRSGHFLLGAYEFELMQLTAPLIRRITRHVKHYDI